MRRTSDVVRVEIDVIMPPGFGFSGEQLMHLLCNRCHLYGLKVRGASSGVIDIIETEEDNAPVDDPPI